MKRTKKILSLFLALVMVLSTMGTAVFASEAGSTGGAGVTPLAGVIVLDEDNGNAVSTDPTGAKKPILNGGNYLFPAHGEVVAGDAYTKFDYQTMMYVPEFGYWPEKDSEGSTWYRADVKGVQAYAQYTPSETAAAAGKTEWNYNAGRSLPRAWHASYNLAATWYINGTDASAKNVTVPAGEYNIIIKGRVPKYQGAGDKSFFVVVDDASVGAGKARGYNGGLTDVAHPDYGTVKMLTENAGGGNAYYWANGAGQTVRDFNYYQIYTNLKVTADGEQHRISIVGREGFYTDKIFLVPVGTSGLTTDTMYYEGNELIAPIEAADTDNVTATFVGLEGNTLATITYDKKLAGQAIPAKFDGDNAISALALPANTDDMTYYWSQATLPATDSTISMVAQKVEKPEVVILDEDNVEIVGPAAINSGKWLLPTERKAVSESELGTDYKELEYQQMMEVPA